MLVPDVIDAAAGVQPQDPLHALRRLRGTVVDATQASHDALLTEPAPGLSTADRLRVAQAVCAAAGATELQAHYAGLLQSGALGQAQPPSPALPAMQQFAAALTVDPRQGDRAAVQALQRAGVADAAIVALAQLVGFLSYQTRVVAGLKALRAAGGAGTPATGATR
jgi:uncharacterized protein YciW